MEKQKSYAYRKLTDKQKTEFTRIALGLAGISVKSDQTPELIWRTFEAMQKLGGRFSLRDGTAIKYEVERRHENNHNKEMKKNRADILKYLKEGL